MTQEASYSIDDLVTLTDLSARSVRHYIKLHLVPRPPLAGSATRYPRATLGMLNALATWRRDSGLFLADAKRRLRALTPDEIEAWAEKVDPTAAPEEDVATLEAAELPSAASTAPASAGAGLALGERWVEVPLLAGLRLMLREGSGAMTARIAEEIQAKYGAT
jgi:DNA-binding transcriptional MerR regulator